jgi:medium-chain acyl-[acyl-carrier-protein] hydrolase
MEQSSTESGIWRESLRIHSFDVDFRKRATAETLCRSFLEGAWNHAAQLGIGYAELAKHNQLWVLARLLLVVDGYPEWGHQVTLTTWPRGISGVFALRDFEFLDAQGARLAGGASSWLVLDAATHRPKRIDKILSSTPDKIDRKSTDREPSKLQPTETSAAILTTIARYSDIDVNNHVNSARYIGWLLDSYSLQFHQGHSLRSLEINYLGETLWGEAIAVSSHQRSPLEFSHSIVNAGGIELCRANLEWKTETAHNQLSSYSALK